MLNCLLNYHNTKICVEGKEIYEVDRYNRFYYRLPWKKADGIAIGINNLNSEALVNYRKNTEYPLYFTEDIDDFIKFSQGIYGFISHNLDFDKSFLPFEISNGFCTLKATKNIKNYQRSRKTLKDLACHYDVIIDPTKLHNSMYDTEVLFEVFKGMVINEENEVRLFMEKSKFPEKMILNSQFNDVISYKEYYYKYKNKIGKIKLYHGNTDRSALYTQFMDATKLSINVSRKKVGKILKEYLDFNGFVSEYGKTFFLNNINEFTEIEFREMTCEEKEMVVFREGNIGIIHLMQNINNVLPEENRISGTHFNNYMVRRGVLSKDGNTTVVNENSYDYGIINEDMMDESTGEINSLVRYTDKGKAFVLENYEWILGLKDIIGEKYQSIECSEERSILIKKPIKTIIVRKEIDISDLKSSLQGARVAITGKKHLDFSRKELEQAIISLGGEVSKSLTSSTSLLIVGENAGSKKIKAEKQGTMIIELEKFIDAVMEKK